MKTISRIAAASAILLTVCASAQTSAATGSSPNASSSTLYCWKDKLYPAGNDLVCNWADNTHDACKGGPVSNVNKDSIKSEPTNIKRCNNGEWLVMVTKK